MTGPISTGTCNLCGKDFAKSTIIRHLKKCLQERAATPTGGKTQKTFWINVWGTYLPDYWLQLEMPASAKLADLDQFLRDIWLECCGHLSAFTIGGTRYELDTGMADAMWKDFFGPSMPTKSMSTRLYTILKPGLKFDHEYDFGTTTELSLKVVAEQTKTGQSKEIRVLARNNPPDIRCAKCGKPATRVCSQCIYEGSKAWLCEQHAEKHKCGEDMFLPVVNSPRVGQCGYTGGAALEAEF
jgi:hypothetical protein